MWQVISMRNPVYFMIVYLVGVIFVYLLGKTLYRERILQISMFGALTLLLYYFVKFFDFHIAILVLVPIVAALMVMKEKRKKKFKLIINLLFPIFLLLLTMCTAGIIETIIFGDSLNTYYKDLQAYEDYLIVVLIILPLETTSALFFSGIIKMIQKRGSHENTAPKYIFFLWTPISNLVFYYSLLYILNGRYYYVFDALPEITYVFASMIVFTCILNIVTFWFIGKLEQVEMQNKQYEKELVKNKLDYQEAVLVDKNKTELRKIRHDMNNILLTVKSLVSIGQNDDAIGIINKTIGEISTIDGIQICSNATLNALLSIKKQQGEKDDITFKIVISENAPLKIDNYDICRIASNLIDNAMEAVKKAENKTIEIQILIEQDSLTFQTRNQYDSSEIKREQINRGNGKSIIKEITAKYNGKYAVDTKKNQYLCNVFLLNKNNI